MDRFAYRSGPPFRDSGIGLERVLELVLLGPGLEPVLGPGLEPVLETEHDFELEAGAVDGEFVGLDFEGRSVLEPMLLHG